MNDKILDCYALRSADGFYAHLESMYLEIDRLNAISRPVKVLEWGSGISTIHLCERLKEDSFILSMEHDEEYRLDIPEQYRNKLSQVIMRTQKPMFSEAYTTHPAMEYLKDGVPYDLIVIDGRNRADCLAVAAMLLADDGTVILGDAERTNYYEAFRLFQSVDIQPFYNRRQKTAVLRQPLCRLSAIHKTPVQGV